MKYREMSTLLCLVLGFLQSSCGAVQTEAPTSTPQPPATETSVPSPTPTPRPTRTPNLANIEPAEDSGARIQKYFDLGYLETIEGKFFQYNNFKEEWAQLGWYSTWPLSTGPTTLVEDFFISAHFKWSSAYRNADDSGCGFVFAIQDDHNHYAVFLDRRKIIFVEADSGYYYSRYVGLTRGTGLVNFGNPADQTVEADFTLIVTGVHAYVLVNEIVVGEYTLSQSRNLRGSLGVSLLSGTNRDFGTRCEVSNIQLWIPSQ